jgi:hypothetical protein
MKKSNTNRMRPTAKARGGSEHSLNRVAGSGILALTECAKTSTI